MNVNLLTDATKHNLALMKIATFHKKQGDYVCLKGVGSFDLTYGSWLFDFSPKGVCDIEGGPGVDMEKQLPYQFQDLKPDYDLYGLDFSIGYTWSWCPRKCPFCIVPKQNNPRVHKSIWSFHDSRLKKICLLNNNTFSDPDWRETFEEIWDANLTVIDENGYDLRLLDDEKTSAIKRTKIKGNYLHFAWDQMRDEPKIKQGLELLKKYKLNGHNSSVYVLIGFNTTEDEDIHRCQVVNDYGLTPYPMPFHKTKRLMAFKRFINLHYYRKFKTIREAWKEYKGNKSATHGQKQKTGVFNLLILLAFLPMGAMQYIVP